MEAHGNGQAFTAPSEYPGFKPPEPHELPSGAVFLLRKPQVVKMMQRGQIPNPLMSVINEIFEDRDSRELRAEAEAKGITVEELLAQRAAEGEQKADDPSKAPPPPTEEELEDVLTPAAVLSFRDVIVWATIAAPKVEMEPPVDGTAMTASGALSYDAIDEDDIKYILQFANGEVAAAATFPPEPERKDAGGDGRTLVDEAEPVAGHPA